MELWRQGVCVNGSCVTNEAVSSGMQQCDGIDLRW